MSKNYSYVYLITEISTNKKYIGVRSRDINPENDLGKTYFSSSTNKDFINRQKSCKEDYLYEVLSIFKTRKEANEEEIRLHDLYNVGINEKFYNKAKSKSNGFDTSGKIVVKDENNNTMLVPVNDPRYLSGELISTIKNKVVVKNKNDNIFQVDKNDPRYLSKELVSINKSKVAVKDKDGNTFQCDINDSR